MIPKQVNHFERDFCLPNKRTYTMQPVKRLFEQEINGGIVIDLFSFPYKTDALEYIQTQKSNSADVVTFDPPYSDYELGRHYLNKGISPSNGPYYKKLRNECFRVIKPDGKIIVFGWNSVRFPGFKIERILLLNHGGMHNDTIITVQQKIQNSLVCECDT